MSPAPPPLRLCRSRRRGEGEGRRAPAGCGLGGQVGPGQAPPRGAGGPSASRGAGWPRLCRGLGRGARPRACNRGQAAGACGNTGSPSCVRARRCHHLPWCPKCCVLVLNSLCHLEEPNGQLWWPRVLGKFPRQHGKVHRPRPCRCPTSWHGTRPAFPELVMGSCWPWPTWLMQSTGLRKVLLSRRSVAPRDCRCLARVAEAWPSNAQRKGPATESTTTRRAMPRDSRTGTLVLTHSSKVSCGSEGWPHGLCWPRPLQVTRSLWHCPVGCVLHGHCTGAQLCLCVSRGSRLVSVRPTRLTSCCALPPNCLGPPPDSASPELTTVCPMALASHQRPAHLLQRPHRC